MDESCSEVALWKTTLEPLQYALNEARQRLSSRRSISLLSGQNEARSKLVQKSTSRNEKL